MPPDLFALGEKKLHPQTDPQEGLARTDRIHDRFDELEFLQVVHAVFEGAHAGEDDLICVGDLLWIARDHGVDPQMLEGLVDAAKISHSIIDDCNHCPYKDPFVEGTPLTRGSVWVAISQALEKALKIDSTMWCLFLP